MAITKSRGFRRVFGPPTLGGQLTIANAVGSCLLMAVALRFSEYFHAIEWAIIGPFLVLGFPLVDLDEFFFRNPLSHYGSESDVVCRCFLIGVNSFVWGYGLAWLIGIRRALREAEERTKRAWREPLE